MSAQLIHVVDNFYPSPDKVRREALRRPFIRHPDYGVRATRPYHLRGVKDLLEGKFKIRIGSWNDSRGADPFNGAFYSAFATGERADEVVVHYDRPSNWAVLIVYMTPNAPCEAGTSIWQHLETGLTARPTKRDAERLGTSVQGLDEILHRDRAKIDCWREIDRIGNLYNRAVMFPAKLLHSASKHFGSNPSSGRIYQGFQFRRYICTAA
ncbi:MAG: DUF6445 family protein [Blastocatellia bacterium]